MTSKDQELEVSVVIPCFNECKTIATTLKRVREAPCEKIQIIVVDDASTDDSLSIIRSYADPRLRVIQRKENRGVVEALNGYFVTS